MNFGTRILLNCIIAFTIAIFCQGLLEMSFWPSTISSILGIQLFNICTS